MIQTLIALSIVASPFLSTKSVQVPQFSSAAAFQKTEQWCWAAGMEMVLKSKKIEFVIEGDTKTKLTQKKIVEICFGTASH